MRKTSVLHTRISHTEQAALNCLVALLNADGRRLYHRRITRSSLMRACLRSALETDLLLTDPALAAELQAANRQLQRVGTNLNQLSRAHNAGLVITPVDTANLFTALQAGVATTQAAVAHEPRGAGGLSCDLPQAGALNRSR